MRFVLLIAAVSGLAACEKPVEQMGYAERVQLVEQIIQRCEALGIPRNSPQMQQCGDAEIEKEVTTRNANVAARRNAGLAMTQASANYNRSMAAQRMNCTHTPGYGGSVTTSCY